MSGEEKHLTIEQIERWLEIQPGAENPCDSDLLVAKLHLANCAACRRLVSVEKDCDHALRGLRQEFPVQASRDCPPAIRFYELAAHLIEVEDSDRIVKHATECDRCGPMLRQAAEQLGAPATDQELAVLASLKSSQPEWQAQLGGRLASNASSKFETNSPAGATKRANFQWNLTRMVWTIAASTAIVIAILAIAAIRRSRPTYTESLLAQAYSEQRTIELRFPGAKHSLLSHETRGVVQSSVDRPQALQEAEHILHDHEKDGPANVAWLQARVRAELLDGHYPLAVQFATRALQEAPNSPTVLNDAATAYFERGKPDATNAQDPGNPDDYGTSFDYLSRALLIDPNDTVVLFNRAIVAETLKLYSQAEGDWNRYLQIETDEGWKTEAREKLEKLKETLSKQKAQSEKTLASPDEVFEALSSGESNRIKEIDSSADEYLKKAMEEWIPQLVLDPTLNPSRRQSLNSSLSLLAADLRTNHSDAWLFDFLSDSSFLDASQAIRSLVLAMQSNSKGNHEEAVLYAVNAESEFQRAGSEPGRARAAFETIYSNRLAARGKQCYYAARALADEARDRHYLWIEVQTRLEEAACAREISKVDESVAKAQSALELAESSKYENLELRAIVFSADIQGDPARRLRLVDEGLVLFWKSHHESMRGYSLYAVMDTCADDLHLWFWDQAAIKEGLRLIETDPDRALQGLEVYRLAGAQLAAGETDEALRTSAQARSILTKGNSRSMNAGASLDLAEAFVTKGDYKGALDLIDSVQPDVSTFTQDVVLAKYYSTRAAALIGKGQDVEAAGSLLSALQLARKGISSISEERDRLAWLRNFEPVYRYLARLRLEKDPEESFLWWESFKGGSIGRSATIEDDEGSSPVLDKRLPSFESWEDGNTLLLSFAAYPDGIAVWAYDGKHVEDRLIPNSLQDTDSLVRVFSAACADPNSDPDVLLLQGRQLYEALLQPLRDWIRGRSRLIIETDDSLVTLPFEALVDEHSGYLADSFEIEYSPGVFYIAQNQRSAVIDQQSRALVVGQSLRDSSDGLLSLRDAVYEAREVAGNFEKPIILLDNDATLHRVLQTLPRADVFHFAGHAVGTREFTSLVLAAAPDQDEPRFLDVRNLDSRTLSQARLVVLSGCATANGIGSGLNDQASLARSALAAGVPNVVASRWSLDSLAAREWMKLFYEGAIAAGNTAAAAKRARLGLRKNKEWRHPYYWACFGVFV